jgi:hypothetical protein
VLLEVKICILCVLAEVEGTAEFPSGEVPSGISVDKCVWWLEISVVSENPISVISKSEVV